MSAAADTAENYIFFLTPTGSSISKQQASKFIEEHKVRPDENARQRAFVLVDVHDAVRLTERCKSFKLWPRNFGLLRLGKEAWAMAQPLIDADKARKEELAALQEKLSEEQRMVDLLKKKVAALKVELKSRAKSATDPADLATVTPNFKSLSLLTQSSSSPDSPNARVTTDNAYAVLAGAADDNDAEQLGMKSAINELYDLLGTFKSLPYSMTDFDSIRRVTERISTVHRRKKKDMESKFDQVKQSMQSDYDNMKQTMQSDYDNMKQTKDKAISLLKDEFRGMKRNVAKIQSRNILEAFAQQLLVEHKTANTASACPFPTPTCFGPDGKVSVSLTLTHFTTNSCPLAIAWWKTVKGNPRTLAATAGLYHSLSGYVHKVLLFGDKILIDNQEPHSDIVVALTKLLKDGKFLNVECLEIK